MRELPFVGSEAREKFYRCKSRPACPRTVLGLAQQRVALMCGPGPGALVGVQKKGRTFVPLYLCTDSRSRAHGRTKQTGEVNRGKTEAQHKTIKSNAKAETTKE